MAALSKLAQELSVTNNNLVLAWLLHQQRVIPIIGFSKKEQYFKNMEAVKIKLTAEQIETLNSAIG